MPIFACPTRSWTTLGCTRAESAIVAQADFRPADWPGRTVEDRLAFWVEARRSWHEERGWPGGALAMMRGASDVRRRLEGVPLLSWGRDPEELAPTNGHRGWLSPSRRASRAQRPAGADGTVSDA